nr:mediator of RNA polymerase II transcription subunit 14 [Tanacetum cinerariifolium]
MLAAQSIQWGINDVVMACGTVSMSNVPKYIADAMKGYKFGHDTLVDGMVKDRLWGAFNDFKLGNYGEICADMRQGPDMDVGKKDLISETLEVINESTASALNEDDPDRGKMDTLEISETLKEVVVSIIGIGIGSGCQQLASTLSSHETCFTQTADLMFYMHEGLQQARSPIYDVTSAIEILLTGTYERLPKCTKDVDIQSTLTDKQHQPVLKKLDTLVRSKLLETALPKEFFEVKISDGTVMLFVQGDFKVLLPLVMGDTLQCGEYCIWRTTHDYERHEVLHVAVLEMIAEISRNKKSSLAFKSVVKKVSDIVVGIACSGVDGLRDASMNTLRGLASIDTDLIWLPLANVYYYKNKEAISSPPPVEDLPPLFQLVPPPSSPKSYLYV